jgi:ribosomal protein S18 acetylase RimI-like enzyme
VSPAPRSYLATTDLNRFPMPSQNDAGLDNPVLAALSTVHAGFAQTSGRAMRYPDDVAPFFALPSPASPADWEHARGLLAGTAAAVMHDGPAPPDTFKIIQSFDVVQMVGDHAAGSDEPEAVSLGTTDLPEMLELVRRTNPGPFLDRTIELGEYLGIRSAGELVAMAGERMHLAGWTEISAVCTAPTHRGLGLASRLVSALVARIERRSERPFLHVLTDNSGALRLYETLGFSVRRRFDITVVMSAAG